MILSGIQKKCCRNTGAALLFLLVLLSLPPARSQNLAFDYLNFENGLSQNSVFAIQQDSLGFLWFGTRFGLNRYDGRNFKIYRHEQGNSASISDEFTTVIFCDSRKNLWVGTHHGLNKYDPEKDVFKRISHKQADNNADLYDDINCICEDKKGVLWIGTRGGLCQLKDSTYDLCRVEGNEQLSVRNATFAILEDTDGLLWVGTNNGLVLIKQSKNEYYQAGLLNHNSTGASLIDDNIAALAEDYNHHIWIGTQKSGVDRYDKSSNQFTHFTHNATDSTSIIHNMIRNILLDRTGKLWIGTQEGLSILDPATGKCTSFRHDEENKKSLTQNSIHSIFQDTYGAIWIGTYFGGINMTYQGAYTPFKTYQNTRHQPSISNNVISSIVEDEKKNLWIGTEGGGLNYYHTATRSFLSYKNNPNAAQTLGSNLVKIVYRDFDNNIWVGTHGGGLNLFDPLRQQFTRFLYLPNDPATIASEITSIMEDKDGHLWVGTLLGLKLFTRKKIVLEPYTIDIVSAQIKTNIITALFQDTNNNIWIGTKENGLFLLPEHSNQLVHFTNDKTSGLKTNNINCITQDTKGTLWVGLYYGGISRYDYQQKKFLTYTEKDGLPNNNVLGILDDSKGNLWISTDNGLSRFGIATRDFMNYTIDDGLAGNQFNNNSFLKTSDGQLFFGGYNGLTSFFPDKIETNKNVAKVVLTALKLFNKPVDINSDNKLLSKNFTLTNEIKLQYNQNVLTVEFALLNFIKPAKNRYKYMLQGFDKDWNEVTVPSATYTNLASGDYVLLVKGANNDGIWSEPTALRIKILPPFWKTWWAFCLYVLIIAAVFFFIIRFFWIRALYKKEHEMYQYKIDFFTNISHEIRTHLTLVIGPIEAILNTKKQDTYLNQQLKNVKNNADRLLKLVSELLDFRKAETRHLQLKITQQDIVPFVNEIYSSFLDTAVSRNITTSFVTSQQSIDAYFDTEQIEKVFFNLLSNAFKFTQDGGHITLEIQQQKDSVQLSVTDNGRGIATEHLEKLFTNFFQVTDYGVQNTGYGIGLAFSKTIVELHKGTLKVESRTAQEHQEGFTRFTVKLLSGKEHLDPATLLPELPHRQDIDTEKPIALIQPDEADRENKRPLLLIVEDNEEVRKLIYDSLEQQYDILESTNGVEGWKKGTEQIPDLIISDVMMPDMDGFTLCKKLKTDTRTSHIPVLLLTAKTAYDDQLMGLETGADMYLQKPFSIELLQLNIRNILATREKLRARYKKEPDLAPQKMAVNTVDEAFLNQLLEIIDVNMEDPEFSVDTLSKKMAMSQPVLYKKIKALTGMSVNDFMISIRLKKAARLLLENELNISETAYAVGYLTPKYFSKEFKKQYGKTPSEYKAWHTTS
jgi:ligand-binding sensor domain-containing protein/signal transduction histidine kinase/DNA-binding response OmpR family regulator